MENLENQILDDIVDGYLLPGTKLNIRELCEKYESGPTPVREALSSLVETHLVEKVENKGFRVAPVTERELRDVHHVFTEIETLALKEAMKHGDEDWEANIMASLYKLKKVELSSSVNYPVWAPLNDAFHRSLISGCNSKCLMEIRDKLYLRGKRYVKLAFDLEKTNLEINYAKHDEIAKLVLQRNSEKACKVLKQHFNESWDDLVESLRQRGAFND